MEQARYTVVATKALPPFLLIIVICSCLFIRHEGVPVVQRSLPAEEPSGCNSGSKVLEAAVAAWRHAGRAPIVVKSETSRFLATIGLPADHRVEVLIEDEVDDIFLERLAEPDSVIGKMRRPTSGESDLCLVLPLKLMGRAHDIFHGQGLDLQAWWRYTDGSVVFGTVEKA